MKQPKSVFNGFVFYVLWCAAFIPTAPLPVWALTPNASLAYKTGISGIAFVAVVLLAAALYFWQKNQKASQGRQELADHFEKLDLLVENSEEGILVVKKLKFMYANQKVYQMMGIKKSEQVSNNLVDFVHPDDLKVVLEHYEKSILTRKEVVDFEIRLVRPDEVVVWMHCRFVPAIWKKEPVTLAFMRDISERKMLEKDLHQAQRLEAIGALSGGIAHEFNNILTSIIGSAEVALMDLSDSSPGRKEFLRIREAGHRASNLVRQILTITREHTLDVQPLALAPLVKEGLKLLRTTLGTNVRIIEKVDRGVHLVKADSIQMYQVFMNLCTNASHAMEAVKDPCLEVVLKNETFMEEDLEIGNGLKPGQYVTLCVKDNGAGIDPEIEEKLFEPYFSTKDDARSTGLGLTTTLGIVKQYEGYISYRSALGDGSCFKVYLPAYHRQKESESTPLEEFANGKGGRILFVEDEEEIAIIARKMLETAGFSVMVAHTGKEALQYFTISPDLFDVLITDMAMPEMTGEELIREIGRIKPGFPMILCTGHSDRVDEAVAKASGATAYINKPYDFKYLSQLASECLKKGAAA